MTAQGWAEHLRQLEDRTAEQQRLLVAGDFEQLAHEPLSPPEDLEPLPADQLARARLALWRLQELQDGLQRRKAETGRELAARRQRRTATSATSCYLDGYG